jgi:hypothetical protein
MNISLSLDVIFHLVTILSSTVRTVFSEKFVLFLEEKRSLYCFVLDSNVLSYSLKYIFLKNQLFISNYMTILSFNVFRTTGVQKTIRNPRITQIFKLVTADIFEKKQRRVIDLSCCVQKNIENPKISFLNIQISFCNDFQ